MSDEPQEPQEPRIFTLTEAERTRREIEPMLIEAMDARRKLAEAESQLSQLFQPHHAHGRHAREL